MSFLIEHFEYSGMCSGIYMLHGGEHHAGLIIQDRALHIATSL